MSRIIDELESLLTPGELEALQSAYGGMPFPFPVHCRGLTFERLATAVGRDAAVRLCARFGGERIDIPTGASAERSRRRAEIVARVAAGESVITIARTFRCSTRWVRILAARSRSVGVTQ